jgi:GT2 family glycosyltransferase
VDNGSGTGEGVRLAAEFGVASVSLPSNGGVPVGYNAAITWAREQGATHVLLANNDLTFSDPDLILRLMAHTAADVAGVGAIVRRADGSIASAGVRIHHWSGHAQRTRTPWARGPYEVDALDGACILVSIDAICRIGGLAPEYFLYWEETDWCARARKSGLRLLVDPDSSVTHAGWGSGDRRQTRRYALRNSLLYVRRNIGGPAGVTASLAWLFGRLPIFVVRRLAERANPRGVVADAGWAIGWHLRDAARRQWRIAAEGPDLCG